MDSRYSRIRSASPSLYRSASTSFHVVAAPVTLARSSSSTSASFDFAPRGYLPPDRRIRRPWAPLGVVGQTPHYVDRYPYVTYTAYSQGAYAGYGHLAEATAYKMSSRSTTCPSTRGSTGTHAPPTPSWRSVTRSSAPSRDYCRLSRDYAQLARGYGGITRNFSLWSHDTSAWSRDPYSTRMGVDDAINMYQKRYLTAQQLSKYWLTPKPWENRLANEKKQTALISVGQLSVGRTSRASKLWTIYS